MDGALANDLAAIARISAVPTILRTIRETTGLRVTLISRVLPDRWIACAIHDEIAFGLKVGGELDISTTLCREVRDALQPLVIDHASLDAAYCDHPSPKMYGFESYIAVPIFRRNGEYFGNICGLDPQPHLLSEGKTLATLKLFGELISLQLEAEERHEGGRKELEGEQEAAKLREQFIAVLGHDLRNPLSSVAVGTELLSRRISDPGDRRVLERIRASTRRMTALVDDVLDLARGRLAGGIASQVSPVEDLEPRLSHVVAEVQASHRGHDIRFECHLHGPIECDERRIEQVLSNLLANATEHGAAGTRIAVSVSGDAETFVLKVTNEGPTIPPDAMARLFQPYFRAAQSGKREGLGLGLYIVSEVAKSHGGHVDVVSANDRTTFTFTIPRARR